MGTGRYKFLEYVPGDRIVLERNDSWWGGKPGWARVTFKPIKSGPSRVAALLAGDVDLIDQTPTVDIERLAQEPGLNLSQGISNRVIYLHMDQFREDSPFVKAKDGGALGNPLRDVRVRKAISKAINRDAIVSRVMEGLAIKAGQLLPEGFFGVSDALDPEAYDPEGAKQLLAEAGVPDGFKLTLHGPNDRYVNDAKIAEAVGQMLTRIGIETEVVTMPRSVYFKRASRGGEDGSPEFSFVLVGWGSGTGEASSPLKSLLATYDRAKGRGAANRGRHSAPELDALLDEALATVVIALVLVQWAYYARTVRGSALVERRKEYIEAATCLALSHRRIVFRHLLPNCLPPMIVVGTLQTAHAISLEATLSFLGVGLPQTEPSLGLLIANGFEYMLSGKYWISLFPGVALLVTIVSINLVGDRLRDVLNPRLDR